MTTTDLIEAIYRAHEHHILPSIGAAYTDPLGDDLRVLALGINSYVSPKDWPPRPGGFRAWIRERRDRYQKGLAREVGALAQALGASRMFAGKVYDPARCLYATNAIKVYMREERGKAASDLTEADFAAHVPQWHEELRVLGEADVTPHVIAVFGKLIWSHAWQAFHPEHHGGGQGVTEFQPIRDDAPHHLNRVVLGGDEPHELLLVRLGHPSRAAKQGTGNWLIETQAFRQTVGAS